MNLYLISLLDSMVEQNIALFCKLNFVESAVYLADLNQLSIRLQILANFYFDFLLGMNFLDPGVFKVDYIPSLDVGDEEVTDLRLKRVLTLFVDNKLNSGDILPVHMRYSDIDDLHLVAGVVKIENKSIVFLHLVDLHIPKRLINSMPQNVSYVREIYDSYDVQDKLSLRDLIKRKGCNYNQFQKDCRTYFGDTFYRFLLKQKILEAVTDIIFTSLSLKEIAFRNKFVDYANMYKTFARCGVTISNIPRLANL